MIGSTISLLYLQVLLDIVEDIEPNTALNMDISELQQNVKNIRYILQHWMQYDHYCKQLFSGGER